MTFNPNGFELKSIFTKRNGQILRTNECGGHEILKHYIDLFALKILALLLCRDSKQQKTKLFLNLIEEQPQNVKTSNNKQSN